MQIYFEEHRNGKLHQGGPRLHPWTVGTFDENYKYYNFLEKPELIETNLEDFLPYADTKAVQTFLKCFAG